MLFSKKFINAWLFVDEEIDEKDIHLVVIFFTII